MDSKGSVDTYIIRDAGDEWVNPIPADEAIVDAVTSATDLTPADVDDIDTYVDPVEFSTLFDGATTTLTFTVEGHEVTVDSTGDIDVET
jgi:hypothetical protein